ncbi:ABC transporter ATP-binding protein [Butyrivibrio sp. FC2001]|uniref:ABC transporter ATP-binding protein n=1 Tax=Butyrivibrio sp. FC2001 TaxID=1280671 RepID=UPI00042A78E6|nr:ABC transporter ATP-binding protein [Butyrivibrio sp. FC2001]
MNKNGRTLSEDIKLIRRGMTEFGTFLPGQLKLLFIHSLITMTIPYIGIYMTSAIISELSGSKRVTMLMTRTGTSLVLILVLTIIAALLYKKISVGYNQLFPAHEIRLNEKANAMKYSLLENEKVRALRDEVSGSIDCSGAGMGSLYWDCGSIFNAIISGMISITILVSGFGIKRTPINAAPSPLGIADSLWGYLILIVVIAVSAAVSCKMTSKIFDVSFDVFLNGAKYNRYSNYYKLEYLSDDKSAKDVRLYSQKDLILNEVLDKCYIPFAEGDKREKDASSRGNGVLLLLSAITGGVVYILIGAKAMHGSIGIGNVLLIYAAVTMLIKALTDFAMTFTDLRNNNEHLIRYFDYVSMDEESSSEKTTPEFPKGEVSVNNLSFKYPGTKAYALRDISLSIKNGEKIAIVGANGSGKTTLVKLICGLYDIAEGSITIGDEPVSVVFQDFSLLSLPLGNNIAAGALYDKNKVWNALEKVGMRKRIEAFDNKLDQPLFKDYDEDGTDLSGGEAQKIAIARGIYKDSPLFILDEPTAALDPKAEYEIFTRMNEISEGKTTIFISHRLYSCKFCDRVIVMDKGRIVQEGTHDELVGIPGKYSEMWNAQAHHYINA